MSKVQLRRPYVPTEAENEILDSFKDILRSGRLTLGSYLNNFEARFAAKLGVRYALGLTSATAGLHLSMVALDIHPGDEVIVPAKTFVSTANAVVFCGGRPVFCDVQEKTMNMDPKSLKKRITSKTKAVIPVHVAGQPCDIDEIMEICSANSLPMVEDSAHAPYALYKGKPSGTFGRMGVYSFYPDKVMASSDGGMIVTDDSELAERLHLLRNCGRRALGDPAVILIGYNYRMNEFQAAVCLQQLQSLDSILVKRREIAKYYDENLSRLPGVETPYYAPNRSHDFYAYVIRVLHTNRHEFQRELTKLGIENSIMFNPVYTHQPYIDLYGDQRGSCPVAEMITEHDVSIPLHPGLNTDDLEYVCSSIKSILSTATISV